MDEVERYQSIPRSFIFYVSASCPGAVFPVLVMTQTGSAEFIFDGCTVTSFMRRWRMGPESLEKRCVVQRPRCGTDDN